jgi:hypothetical protein
MKKRSFIFSWVIIFVVIFFCIVPYSFSQLEDAIEQLTGKNTKGYLKPFTDAFGSNLNSGVYRTALVPRFGFNIYIGVIAMGTIISNDDLFYMGTPPSPYPEDPVKTATVFGKEGTVVEGPGGLSYVFQDGQIQGTFAPLAIPHLELGSLFGSRIKLRYFSFDLGESTGKLELVGYGLQHSINQYIPLLPLDISFGIFTQSLELGDIISAQTLSYGIQASKSFSLLTLYSGVSMDNTTMDVVYTYKGEENTEEIALELKSQNNFRLSIGARLVLAFLILNSDFSIGGQNIITLGVGFGL